MLKTDKPEDARDFTFRYDKKEEQEQLTEQQIAEMFGAESKPEAQQPAQLRNVAQPQAEQMELVI